MEDINFENDYEAILRKDIRVVNTLEELVDKNTD